MTERNLFLREDVADLLDIPLHEQNPLARRGRTQGDLVRAVVSAGMYSHPLHAEDIVESDDENDIARAWRFIVPMENEPRGIQIVEFGVTMKDINGASNTMTRLDNEGEFDQHVEASASDAVVGLFRYIGGDITRKVYENDKPFFAGMERRYRFFETSEGMQYTSWIQLVYPEEMMGSLDAVGRQNVFYAKNGRRPRNWMERAAKKGGVNRIKTANAMAMSAFWTIKRHLDIEHADEA